MSNTPLSSPQGPGSLFESLYDQLREIAGLELQQERAGHTLQPTALVNEAYARIRYSLRFESREQFLSYASTAMRRILVDHARARLAKKRGGRAHRLTLTPDQIRSDETGVDVLEIDDALKSLEATEPRLARVVELRYFGGLPVATIAQVLDVSEETTRRDWIKAKKWLFDHMSK